MPNLACLSRHMVYTYPPNFIQFSVFYGPWESKNPMLLFFNFVILCWLRPALQRQSWMRVHIYKHSPMQRYQEHFRITTHWWQSGIHKLCYLKRLMDEQKPFLKHQTFSPHGGVRYPSPTKLGMVIEDVLTFLASPKHVRLRRTVSPLQGATI